MKKKNLPAYLSQDYPIRKRTAEGAYKADQLYELACPNPACDLVVRVRGDRVKEMYERLIDKGCPDCKLQFGGSTYQFKDGEKEIDLPQNDGRYKGFTISQADLL